MDSLYAKLSKPTTYYLNIAHYFLVLFLASSYLHTTTKLCFCLGEELPSSVKCVDKEREALLTFKQDLVNASHRLSSWMGHDCCRWKGISCNNRTGHVTKVDLRNTYSIDAQVWDELAYDQSFLGGKLNPSLLDLKYLGYLDLSLNNFQGIHIPSFFGQLKSLRYLNLSFASFVGEIPPSLGNLLNLNYLDLEGGYSFIDDSPRLNSSNLNWLSQLSSLKYLNLGGVNLSSTGVSPVNAVNMLSSLLELHLSTCNIRQNFPFTLQTTNLTSLLILDMSNNHVNSSTFPKWFPNLSSLRRLDLSWNSFSSPFPVELSSLEFLEDLNLFGNRFRGQIPKLGGNFCKLKILNLEENDFHGGIHELLNGFSDCTNNRLEYLNLYMSGFESELPISLGMLHNLQYLDLGFNSFWGSIPETIGNLSALKTLNLGDNQMNGSFPESFGQLSQLTTLDLSWNSWEGILTEAHLKNLTSLKDFSIETDQPMSLIFNVAYDWIPPFKLVNIWMRNCQVGPAFPVWLQFQTKLIIADLSHTGITDLIPDDWFLKISSNVELLDLSYNQIRGKLLFNLKFPHLAYAYLGHNQFEGPLPHWSTNAMGLDLESNFFSGSIPSNFAQLMPGLKELYLSENYLNGTIPASICSMKNLEVFSVRSNQLSGELPQAWSLWSKVLVVDVSNNHLTGNIPSSMGVPSSLVDLKLNNNFFGGQIPSSIFRNCTSLRSIDLGDNRFTGDIPAFWTRSNVSELEMLLLRSNFFSGQIPQLLCNLPRLHLLDLSHNNFSGTITECFKNMTSLVYGRNSSFPYSYGTSNYLEQTMLTAKGMELLYNTTVDLVNSIDLSSNNLEGEIPQEIANLVALGTLNLSRNQFSRSIPLNIGNLSLLETLDLSHNHISGQIPPSLSALTSLSHLNLSYNNLSGRIPMGNQLQTLEDPSIYEGNPSLCGVPLPTLCPGDSTPATPTTNPVDDEKDSEDDNGNLGFFVSVVLGFIIGFWGVCGTLLVKKSWRYAYFRLFDKVALAIALKVARWQRKA